MYIVGKGINVQSTGKGFICLSPPSKCAFPFYLHKDNFVQSDLHTMTYDDVCHVTE